MRFASALRERSRWYPIAALSGLAFGTHLPATIVFLLAPDISRTLGLRRSNFALLVVSHAVAVALGSLPAAAFVPRRVPRAVLVVAAGFAAALIVLAMAFVTTGLGLFVLMLAHGVAGGAAAALHQPVLFDNFPAAMRVRVLGTYRAGAVAGLAAGALVAAAVSGLDMTWRAAFAAAGLASLAAAAGSVLLREAAAPDDVGESGPQAGFFETVRQVSLIPTVRTVLGASAALAATSFPLSLFVVFFLDDEWGIGATGRSLLLAGAWAASIVVIAWAASRGEERCRERPAALGRLASWLLVASGIALAVAAASPAFAFVVVAFAATFGLMAAVTPELAVLLFSVVPVRARVHVAALSAVFSAVGGVTGYFVLGGIDRRFGITTALLSLAAPALAAAAVLRKTVATADSDVERVIVEASERERVARLVARGGHVPMLSCRGVDFSYGQVQVLFHVDFTVDDGEMVALLGTNGAGKSTLLRVISGLVLPSRGSVHLRGHDITYLDAERRVALGVTQVPGGRAVFGPMTVVENLRVFGFSHGRDRRSVERGIEATLEAFPALAARRDGLASTLSGGEQQMLGLGKALILDPQILLIDELSLGLAPRIVGELLEMVRRINAGGTAVVLVEQSVNVALSLVEHAYFMEKGEIRFDGRAADLLDRRDLLRSVFLEGASESERRRSRAERETRVDGAAR